MSDDKKTLLALFNAERPSLLRRLIRRTGCGATADDLLQDTWLRLDRSGMAMADVANPASYLHRMALNLATDHFRTEARRLLSPQDVNALLDVPDDAPDLDAAVAAREELAALRRALNELPERRRAIFLEARVERRPHRDIAERYGVSIRTVELEVSRALEHCASRLGRTSRR